jgi:hypothetical protein
MSGEKLLRKQFSVYDPETKRSKIKNVSGKTIEEIEKKGEEWLVETKKEMAEKLEKMKKEKQEKTIPASISDKKEIIPFKKFSLDSRADDAFSLLCLGSTRSGKTTAIKNILNEECDKHIKVVFTPSLHATTYKDFPKDCLFSAFYFPEVLKDMYMINSKTKNHYPFMCILDDVVDKKYDKELMKLLTIYRNSRMSCIICSQARAIMNATARTNINYVCCFKLNSDEEIEKVIKAYLISRFPADMKMPDKIRYYRQATEDHKFFLIDNFTGEVCLTKIFI